MPRASLACLALLLNGCSALHLRSPAPLRAPQLPEQQPIRCAAEQQPSRSRPGLPAAVAALSLLAPLRAHAEEQGLSMLPASPFSAEETSQLAVFAAQTIISWGIPATVVLTLVALTSGGPREDDEPELPPKLAQALGLSNEPKEYLKVERLNDKLNSFDYSLEKMSTGKSAALRQDRARRFERAFGAEIAAMELSSEQLTRIEKASKRYQQSLEKLNKRQESNVRTIRALALSGKGGAMANAPVDAEAEAEAEAEPVQPTASNSSSPLAGLGGAFRSMKLNDQATKMYQRRLALDQQLLAGLAQELGPQKASALAEVIKDKSVEGASGGAGLIEAFRAMEVGKQRTKRVFVLKFFGDVTASQVSALRQEVTAVLGSAAEGDEVVLILNSGGGTVTGYGLAAAQLTRIKSAKLPLSICVEQVAASGGYMMACVADHLVASPFAVLGSIGVITEQPNVYERLKKEGVVFNTITAGKFKRTLTPTKKVEAADIQKQKDDIEQVLNLFKGFVNSQRPMLDIEKVATGETWFGPDALEQKLVDELATADDVLLRFAKEGSEVLSIQYQDGKAKGPLAALSPGGAAPPANWQSALLALLSRALLNGASAPRGFAGELAGDEIAMPMAVRPRGEAEPSLRWQGTSSRAEPDDDFGYF